jgi:RNA polymerase sigma factor (sigma-70 family)
MTTLTARSRVGTPCTRIANRAGTPRLRPVSSLAPQRSSGRRRCGRVTVPARDHAWAERLTAGDEQALREAYREFAPAVFGLAMRVVSNEPIAEEVVQDVFVRLWERPESFDPTRGPLRAYLLAMTHSRAVERVRSEDSLRRRHEFAQREATPGPGRGPSTCSSTKMLLAIRTAPQPSTIPTRADRDGVLRRDVLPAGCGCTGRAGRHREVRIRCGMRSWTALRAAEVGP